MKVKQNNMKNFHILTLFQTLLVLASVVALTLGQADWTCDECVEGGNAIGAMLASDENIQAKNHSQDSELATQQEVQIFITGPCLPCLACGASVAICLTQQPSN